MLERLGCIGRGIEDSGYVPSMAATRSNRAGHGPGRSLSGCIGRLIDVIGSCGIKRTRVHG